MLCLGHRLAGQSRDCHMVLFVLRSLEGTKQLRQNPLFNGKIFGIASD
jgi:hypothetical protein